jgi:hypothetical protein
MSLKCKEMEVAAGCLTHADGTQENIAIHYEYSTPKVPNGQPCVVIISKTTYTDAAGNPVALAATDVVTPGACPVLVANPIHYCDSTKCFEGKAWYRSGTGTLVQFTDLQGAVITPAGAPLEGPCQVAQVTERDVCVKMSPTGERWNVIERVTTTECGLVTLQYLDPDTSPMKDITDDVGGFVSHGDCDCC